MQRAPSQRPANVARRSSAWQIAGEQAKKGTMNVANAVGRWLGVTASEEEVKERQYAYQRRKSGMDLAPQGIVLVQLILLAHSI